jgi:hypothetical protein
MHKLALVVALVLAPAVAWAQAPLDGAQKARGIVVEARVGSQLLTISTGGGGGSGFSVSGLKGGIFGGYKLGRFIFGLGFDLERLASGTSVGNTGTSNATTLFQFVPGVKVAILRSADKRVELFGEADFGFGTTVTDQTTNVDYFHFSYDVGPGVRYWVHPQFAFSALAGLDGQFEYDTTSNAGVSMTTSSGVTSIFAQLQFMGVF